MDPLQKLKNEAHQRAGLLAIITGIFTTYDDPALKASIASVLKDIFKNYPVGDMVEKLTLMSMGDFVNSDPDDMEDQMDKMMKDINDILNGSSN